MTEHVNHLIDEKSPYLQQHAHNPVMWYPWSDLAFQKAREENKPVFLSIGYSTCHWCHVMERESFEDEEVADSMNRVFISIKVDREERPDLDSFYMNVCQMISGSGGWPLNLILTPDRKPVFAFTYLPKRSRRNLMGIMEMTQSVETLWKEKSGELFEQGEKIVEAIRSSTQNEKSEVVSQEILDKAFQALSSNFDPDHGGFGFSPKFPSPHYLMFLLRYYYRHGNQEALAMVDKTLDGMIRGGMMDQIGGGFHRYSTDAEWKLPHFEKMLYDQAMILAALAELHNVTKSDKIKAVMESTLAFLNREMRDTSGAYYTALDADSEGQEGKFYTWTFQEIASIIGREEAGVFCEAYGCSVDGNFHEEGTGRLTGRNILYLASDVPNVAEKFQLNEKRVEEILEAGRKALFEQRSRRIRPGLDDKILTDVNGLLMWSFAKCFQSTSGKPFLEAANLIAKFLLKNMIDKNGKTLHRYRGTSAEIDGMIDDYAFVTAGFIKLYEATADDGYLDKADLLQRYLDDHFYDRNGGYFNTSQEDVPVRMKLYQDGAIPSGNSFAMDNLLKLGIIFGSNDLIEKANLIAESAPETVRKTPFYHLHMCNAIDFSLGPSYDAVIAIEPEARKQAFLEILDKFNPRVVVSYASDKREDVSAQTKARGSGIFICSMTECFPPVKDVSAAVQLIQTKSAGGL